MCREVAKLRFGPKGRNMYVPPNVAEVMRLLLESRVCGPGCTTDSQFNRFKAHSYSSDKPSHVSEDHKKITASCSAIKVEGSDEADTIWNCCLQGNDGND